jgi:hypothetical protein
MGGFDYLFCALAFFIASDFEAFGQTFGASGV